jgi:single-strand DNA-binding protein
MPSYNKTILMGHLTRDIEIRHIESGSMVSSFGLAVNEKYKTKDGQQKEDVLFIDCTAWGKTGETMQRFLGKGDPVLVEGKLKLDEWQDKETGQNRQKIKLTVGTFSFVGGNQRGGGESHDPPHRDEPSPIQDGDIPF